MLRLTIDKPLAKNGKMIDFTKEHFSKMEGIMGLVYADIELINADYIGLAARGFIKPEDVLSVKVRALADSGAYMLGINERIAEQLDLRVLGEEIFTMANEERQRLKIVGPIEVRFKNRRCTADAVVLGENTEVLLGSIVMEDLDVIIDPKRQELTLPPDRPYLAEKHMK
ncbi:MAG: hypothetical protein NZM06_09365 [Chloroherpetonaceae bacterium]|nr:hypothetical protein [Chloroherpetonaceae bacterium]MDW8437295.1 hypothetical protein [Chloroherpetonaceae bacterium]